MKQRFIYRIDIVDLIFNELFDYDISHIRMAQGIAGFFKQIVAFFQIAFQGYAQRYGRLLAGTVAFASHLGKESSVHIAGSIWKCF